VVDSLYPIGSISPAFSPPDGWKRIARIAPVGATRDVECEGMTRAVFGLLLIAAAMLQATILPTVGPLVVMPNLVLVLILVRTAQCGVADGLLWSLIAGLVLDALALDPIGTNGLALLPVVLAGGLSRRRIFLNGVLFPMLLAVAATLAHAMVLNAARTLGGEALVPLEALLRMSLLQSLLNAVLVPVLWPLVGLLARDRAGRVS
jgi:rod shape-determining protein MreD